MIYAPIIIPTLNRVKHLKLCIKSLQANPWAKYTSLIISVDYPPNSHYVEGYERVCKFLHTPIKGFASVEIIYQNRNLGAYENMLFLQECSKNYADRFIFTEDDNEFAPNFIEYIDKGLEIFEDDENIVAICAVGSAKEEDEKNNVAISQNFAAYGYGTWIKKKEELDKKINRKYLESIAKNNSFMLKLACWQPEVLLSFQSALFQKGKLYQLNRDEVPVIDETIKMYLIMENKYVVGALCNKARNWGRDGSGINCPKDESYMPENIKIDGRNSFEYMYTVPMKYVKPKTSFSLEIIVRIFGVFIKVWIWRLRRKS